MLQPTSVLANIGEGLSHAVHQVVVRASWETRKFVDEAGEPGRALRQKNSSACPSPP